MSFPVPSLGLRFGSSLLARSCAWSASFIIISISYLSNESTLQVFISSFLQQLRILQSLNKFQFFLFHLLYHCFMLESRFFFPQSFLFNLLFRSQLFQHDVLILFFLSFFFRILDHLFQGTCFQILLLSLHLK